MRTFALLLMSLTGSTCFAADPSTSLGRPEVAYQKAVYPYVVLERDDLKAIVVTNEAVDNEHLPDHRAGYSGLGHLSHKRQPNNLFVPQYAGLNFEHIHDGTTQPRDVLFEPRRFPMQLRVIDKRTVELYQKPTENWQLESCTRYQLLPENTIEMTFECIPRAATFRNDYIGLFWANYIEAPESKSIHFRGVPHSDKQAEERWIEGITPKHGIKASHLPRKDERTLKHDEDFPLTLVFNRSDYRAVEPWYYGVSHGMAYIMIFRETDLVRFAQSPSGGGGNPAWDFQYFIEAPQINQRYSLVMRAVYVPFQSREQVEQIARKHAQLMN